MKSYRFLKNEDGSVLPFVALLLAFVLIGLCALVIDAGMLYAERRSLVTAADAAALGGADIFEKALSTEGGPASVETKAREVAINLAIANGVKNRADVDVDVDWNLPYEGKTIDVIKVTVKNNTDLYFAKIFGNDATDVTAEAVATWGNVTKIEGGNILPIFTKFSDYQTENTTYLHAGKFVNNAGDKVSGNWGLIDIYGNTSKIASAFRGEMTGLRMELNYVIDNQTGLNGGNISDPIEVRMQKANTLPEKEDRIKFMSGLVPVIKWENITQQGSSLELPIEFFSVFEIYDVIPKNDGYGSKYALYDTPNYLSDGIAKHYEVNSIDLAMCSIVGKFTGEPISVRAVLEPGDQDPPEEGVSSVTYSMLIEDMW